MKEIRDIIEKNNFIYPDYNTLNLVDLVKTLYKINGVDIKSNDNMEYLKKIIPNNPHMLFILSDGTGSNIINKMPDNSILKSHKKMDLITVFPSTTGCVLNSVVTATYPIKHGIWGWFNYNRIKKIDYYPLLFKDRKKLKLLSEYNIKRSDIFKEKSLLKKIKNKVNVLFPYNINQSEYSKYVAFNKDRHPYNNFQDIIDFMKNNCLNEKSSYTYLYLPDIDAIEHNYGVDDIKVMEKLNEIDSLIGELAKNKNLTIILTADHGQMNVNKDIILDFKKYDKYFYAYPSIDFGTASYYIKKKYDKEFVRQFEKDYGNQMFLFKTKELLDMRIFGIGDYSKHAIDDLGEYISICPKGSYLINSTDVNKYYGKVKGNHSGLSEEEMVIPLIIIDSNNI